MGYYVSGTDRALSVEREERIAALAGCSVNTLREWLYSDSWDGEACSAEEHADWFNAASDAEVADWLESVIR